VVLVVLSHLVGCAGVPLATREEDARAKSLLPQADTSLVYLYRSGGSGGAGLMTIELDGVLVGETAPDTFFLWEVPPGEHVIKATNSLNDYSTLAFLTQPGSVHYVWQEVKLGASLARPFLQQVDPRQGEEAVNDCRLIRAFYEPREEQPRLPAGIIQVRAPSMLSPR
jgi:hypothetical protein